MPDGTLEQSPINFLIRGMEDYRSIANLQGNEYTLVDVDLEVQAILEDIGRSGYIGLIVKLDSSGADYAEVWGFSGIPHLEKSAERLFPN